MKCNVCGKEFGNGANCQNCGSDLITARGNYKDGGYTIPSLPPKNEDGETPKTKPLTPPIANNSIICYNCAEVIPDDSEYCPYCRIQLFVVCPKCGHKYSSRFIVCNHCGTEREEYLEKQRKLEQQRQEQLRKQQEVERQRKLEQERQERLRKQQQEEERQRQLRERLQQLEENRQELLKQEQLRIQRLRTVRRIVSCVILLFAVLLFFVQVGISIIMLLVWLILTLYWHKTHKL